MRKLLALLPILFITFSALAQTPKELNSTQADTLKLYLRTSKSPNVVSAGYGYSIKLDSLQKAFLKLSAAMPIPNLYLATTENKSFGTTTLVSGTKTVTNTRVTANSKILVYLLTPSGTLANSYAAPPANITAGTSFVINGYQSNATVQTGDNSVVAYIIVN